MQYTIEARELTKGSTRRASYQTELEHFIVEAADADEAISRYVTDSAAELVCLSQPGGGSESIATVKKEDSVFLVRIYAD